MTVIVSRPAIGLAAFVALGLSTPSALAASECVDAANAAQTLRRDGRLLEARAAAATCAAEACPAVVRDECAKVAASLETKIPSVVTRVTDEAGADVLGATARLDGRPIPLDGRSRELDPGGHVIEVEPGGGRPAQTLRFLLAEGEQRRAVTVTVAGGARAAKPDPPPPPRPRPEGPSRAVPIALFATSGGLLATGIVFHVLGATREHDLSGSCSPRCAPDDVDVVRTRYWLAGGLYAGAGAVAAAGGVLWLVGGSDKAAIAPGPGGLVVRGRF